MTISEASTRRLLVRSAGRCAICYEDLLESNVTYKDVYLGERAHNVGRSDSERSPRGDAPLPVEARDDVENLLLACGGCHNELDLAGNLDVLTVNQLSEFKARHEARIERLMRIPPDNETTVLAMYGHIGDSPVAVDHRSAAAAAVLSADRFASFPLRPDRGAIEIDLRPIPDPLPANPDYYRAAAAAIDRFVERQLEPAITDGSIAHLSVFGLARWPLLAHLGHRLGDKLPVDIYQRHRTTQRWDWPEDGDDTSFEWEHVDGSGQDVALVLSISATVEFAELPAVLQDAPRYRIVPSNETTSNYDVISSRRALVSAASAIRGVFADIERKHKATKRVHVIGAAPLSVIVELGRAITPAIHPVTALYDRVDNTYQLAMEINS